MDVKYRILFFRKGEEKHFHSCFCWSKFGDTAAMNTIRDLFKLTDNITLKAEGA